MEVTLDQNPCANPSFLQFLLLTCHTMSVAQAPICAFSAENFEKHVMQLAEVSGAKLFGIFTLTKNTWFKF